MLTARLCALVLRAIQTHRLQDRCLGLSGLSDQLTALPARRVRCGTDGAVRLGQDQGAEDRMAHCRAVRRRTGDPCKDSLSDSRHPPSNGIWELGNLNELIPLRVPSAE